MTIFARINSFKQIFTFQFISNHVYVVEERKSRPAVNGFNFFVCVNFTTNVVLAINNFKNTFYVQQKHLM